MTEQAQIIRWEDPPSKRSGGRGFGPSRYTTVAAELRAHRGRWAVIYEGPSGTGLVTAISTGTVSCWAPSGDFEATYRKVGLLGTVYARYLGDGETDDA